MTEVQQETVEVTVEAKPTPTEGYLEIDVTNDSIWNYVKVIESPTPLWTGFWWPFAQIGKLFNYDVNVLYETTQNITYYSKKYNKYIDVAKGGEYDGATYAIDIDSFAWVFHDKLCNTGKFSNPETPCTNWEASDVLYEILDAEGRYVRKHTWFWATYSYRSIVN